MTSVPKFFGSEVFNETVMKDRLPTATYKAFKNAVLKGEPLDLPIANIIANAMKDWALEHGATHFTHWFQPMTGITAEKHESFITPTADGRVIMDFSGKELVQGEPDASSFPSGGLRATFEARGYTAWDPTSYAFIKDGCLYIPTAFCSYTGDVLDKKTPLLRSMCCVDRAARRILKLFGESTEKVITTVGPEQEYFLVDKDMYDKRRDLKFAGRTLFGAMPPKGQELEDHYFGIIKPRVKAFMKELDEKLWELGVLAKTEHNEVAPAQHELAPIFAGTNIATDHNQLTMELMQSVARKHNLVCLLHEKPFDGVNGSGKHNNWSLGTVEGENLLDPGAEPYKNHRFLLFLAAVIKAVDEYQDLLRISVASAGNDHRLGANEAPPAIVSMFLGTELTNVLKAIEAGVEYKPADEGELKLSGNVLPALKKDNTDRNRTSPFAFTGNKFEFRMVGSAASIAGPNVILNAIVAEALEEFADKLEAAADFDAAVVELVRETVIAHKRIIFNGDGYTDAWVEEAKSRGLLNLKSTPEALPYMVKEKNISLFVKHGIFTEAEIRSRLEISLENYINKLDYVGNGTNPDKKWTNSGAGNGTRGNIVLTELKKQLGTKAVAGFSQIAGCDVNEMKCYDENPYDEEHNADTGKGYELKITCIVKLKGDTQCGMLASPICYTQALNDYIIENSASSEVVAAQKENTSSSVVAGATFRNHTAALENLGYAESPTKINFYPNTLEDKDYLLAVLDAYNEGKAESEKTYYVDNVGAVMNIVGMIVDGVVSVLVILTSVSLVVSAIMIGIITYVSVIERTKEIGVLRAVGARKKDVVRLFITETGMIGAMAGAMGIVVTFIAEIPLNAVMESVTGVSSLVVLSPLHVLAILIGSVIVTIAAGLIPSLFASKKDPVRALRSE